MLQVQHSNQRPPNLSKQTNSLYVKGAVFFLVESIAIGKPIRGGRGVDPYTVLLRDAIPAVFYLSQDTSILRGTITLRERRGSLGWRRSLDGGGGGWILPYISHIGTYMPPHQVGFWAFLE